MFLSLFLFKFTGVTAKSNQFKQTVLVPPWTLEQDIQYKEMHQFTNYGTISFARKCGLALKVCVCVHVRVHTHMRMCVCVCATWDNERLCEKNCQSITGFLLSGGPIFSSKKMHDQATEVTSDKPALVVFLIVLHKSLLHIIASTMFYGLY